MASPTLEAVSEHLTPHDLVAYSRCPYEMELARARHASAITGREVTPRTPPDVVPLHRSPLPELPPEHVAVVEGRLEVAPGDRLIYRDEGERGLPMAFAPDQVHLDPRFAPPNQTLIDRAVGLSGRPDFVIQRADGSLVPVEYKSTHLFVGYREVHGRLFDQLQVVAECRLVASAFGRRPLCGLIWYGDLAGDGRREGWVEIPFRDLEERWLIGALETIRSDRIRAPVPSERTCRGCAANRDGRCRFALVRYEADHSHTRDDPGPTSSGGR